MRLSILPVIIFVFLLRDRGSEVADHPGDRIRGGGMGILTCFYCSAKALRQCLASEKCLFSAAAIIMNVLRCKSI